MDRTLTFAAPSLPADVPLPGSIGEGAASQQPPTAGVSTGADGLQSTPSQPPRATNPLIQVQEPTPRQPVISRFNSAESFTGDGSPARKSSPTTVAVPSPVATSPLGAPQPERDTSWEVDSDDEASTAEKQSVAAAQKEEVRRSAGWPWCEESADAGRSCSQADVRAALAAAAQTKPAPVTISLKTIVKEATPAPVAPPVTPSTEPAPKVGRGKRGKAAVASVAASASTSTAPSRTSTPDVAAAATTAKKDWTLPDAKLRTSSPAPSTGDGPTPGEDLSLSRPSMPAAAVRGRQTTKVAETASRATSASSSATGPAALSAKSGASRKKSPSPPPFSAVEQAPIFSRKAKKEKNRTTAAKKKGGKAGATAAAQAADEETAETAGPTPDELAAQALALANRVPLLELGDWYLPPLPAEPSTLSQLLHQLAPVLVASSLSFIAPLSHTRDLIETLSVASCLEPAPLAVALSALTTPTSDVTMEDAVAAFHQLLTLLTDTITGILNILPRDPPRDQDVAKRFGAMFMDVRRGTGLATRFADSVGAAQAAAAVPSDPLAAAGGANGGDRGEREVERLKSALYQRANYLAEQLTRLEDLHEEINSVRTCALQMYVGQS